MLEFSWKAFAFAVVNFLVLVAILYKLLHKPLLDILAKRQQKIEDAQRAAVEEAEKARSVQADYERKLAGIEEERDKMLAEARQRAETAREELMARARAEAEREVANLRRDWLRQERDALDAMQDGIVDVALDLARRVLAQLADTDIETRLQQQLHQELEDLAANADKAELRNLFAAEGPVRVVTASPLGYEGQREIARRIEALSEENVDISFEADPALIAGARVEFSSQAIDASMADVLTAVREGFDRLAPEPEEDAEQ